MAGVDTIRPDERTRRLSLSAGAVTGALATLGFIVIHGLWILDIWDMTGPMLFSGAVSGLVIVWSYNTAVGGEHTPARWFGYNGLIALLLILLGISSVVVLEPKFTMAETMRMDDGMAELMPPAVPIMVVAVLVGTFVLWAAFGRRRRALIPILVAQILIVFFLGHQYAFLGVVEMGDELVSTYGGFVLLTIYLSGANAVGVLLLTRAVRSIRSTETEVATPAGRP